MRVFTRPHCCPPRSSRALRRAWQCQALEAAHALGLLIYGQTWLGLNPSASSLSGCFSDQRHLLEPGSAGLSVCPRVTVTVPERPPDRARGGHDPLIRSLVPSVR
jgi:hypothetical protein